jgi:hypothetical protein
MKKSGMSNLHYILSAILILALTGCGANHNLAGVQADGSIASKLVWNDGKSTSKKVGSPVAPAGVTFSTMKVLVTGSDANGKAIPVVRSAPAFSNSVAIGGIYPGKVTLAVKAFGIDNATQQAVVYEGYAIGVDVASGVITNLDTLAVPKTIKMSPSLEKLQDSACYQCHETALDRVGQSVVAQFKQSGHYTNSGAMSPAAGVNADKYAPGVVGTGCAGCHGPQHNESNPAASGRCSDCHGAVLQPSHKGNSGLIVATNCTNCHQPHNTKTFVAGRCVACHSVAQQANDANNHFVNDNTGVRAITTEFAKWSHHVTGVALNDAHCTACHLEGTVVDGEVVVDTSKHMADSKTHLRNADTDADFAWDPAAPNHTGMDNFCMSCHDANGATSATSVQIQAYINVNGIAAPGKTASAKNPFGDTISNRYDKMQRPAVTDASSQFNTGNNSHHGVKGPRYSGRTRVGGNGRQIASAATFANNSTVALQGVRSTIYDAGNFNALYVPLENDGGEAAPRTGAASLGDDSTMHCGDCHTVGQYRAADVNAAPTSFNKAVIGAHGSNNEYLLRNSIGTDERHTQNAYTINASNVVTQTNPNGAFLVCYNCHAYKNYGSTFIGTGADAGNAAGNPLSNIQSHAGEYASAGRCNGPGNTIPFNGYTTGTATDGTQFESRLAIHTAIYATTTTIGGVTYSANASAQADGIRYYGANPVFAPGFPLVGTRPDGEQPSDFGNAFGIQCLNCHNSGLANAYGGIHGSANNTGWNGVSPDASVTGGAYIDGMGNTNKVERFLPGLGDAMHVPGTLGGISGGVVVPTTTSGLSYTYTTGGISNDTNWEQKHWQQTSTTVINFKTAGVTNGASAGAGCYTLGEGKPLSGDVSVGLVGPSVTGAGGPATEAVGTWGGCDDHTAGQGAGNHGFLKRIIRPVTY